MWRRRFVHACLLWQAGCAGAPAPSERSAAEVDRAPPVQSAQAVKTAPDEEVQTDAARSGEAQAVIADTLKFIAQLRELPALTPVTGQELSREEMVAHVKRTLKEDVPPEVLRATNEFLFLAGVVGADFDYEQSLLDVLGTELAGFYDPKAKRMYLGADLGAAEWRATLAHELVHALQDQHYKLDELTTWQPDAGDRMSALHSLAEGDATSAMLDGLLVGTGRTSLDLPEGALAVQIEQMQNADPSVPGIVKRSVVAPYVDGLEFVQALRAKGGWKLVDACWEKPPSSTEQVLHPEKYLAGELPVPVGVPGAPPGGPTELLYRDVEGEQSLRLLLEEWLPRAKAYEAARDWAGDSLGVYADERRSAFAWHLRFDSEPATKRAYQAVEAWVRGSGGVVKGYRRSSCRDRGDRGPLAAGLQRQGIVVVAGPLERDREGGSQGLGDCASARRWLEMIGAH